MQLHAPLRTITSALDADVLMVLAGADDWFTVSRIHTLVAGRSREGIRNTLSRLREQGAIDMMTIGSTHSYRLNREHLASDAILQLADLQRSFHERLRRALASWEPRPQFAALFGSAAQGRMDPGSDIDLFLLHPGAEALEWDKAVDDLVANASRWTGNPVHPLVLTAEEAQGSAHTEPVLADISNHGIPLVGNMSAFRRLIGRAR